MGLSRELFAQEVFPLKERSALKQINVVVFGQSGHHEAHGEEERGGEEACEREEGVRTSTIQMISGDLNFGWNLGRQRDSILYSIGI